MAKCIFLVCVLISLVCNSWQLAKFIQIPFFQLENLGFIAEASKSVKGHSAKRMDINSNSNIEVPIEIAKQLGLLKPPGSGGCPPCPNPPCPDQAGGPCDVKAKSISEVQINGKGDFINL